MPSTTTAKLGKAGEDAVACYYETHGGTVIARNVRGSSGEIDLLAEQDAELVVVEVKTRSSSYHGIGAAAVTPRKLGRMRKTALDWLRKHPGKYYPSIRFDVADVRMIDGSLAVFIYAGVDCGAR